MTLTLHELMQYCAHKALIVAESLVVDGKAGHIYRTAKYEPVWKSDEEVEQEYRSWFSESESPDGSVGVQDDVAGDSVDMGDTADVTDHEVADVAATVRVRKNRGKKRSRSGAA